MNEHSTISPSNFAPDGMSQVARHPKDEFAYQTIVGKDRFPPPPVLAHENYAFLGDQDISPDRYWRQDFFDQEMDKVWTKVWQYVCREEHIPEAGDYYVYNIGKYSVLVTRTEQGEIKAFYNYCTHRGTKLREGEGVGHAAQFTCPFHGWTFSMEGKLSEIPCKWDFPRVREEDSGLNEIRVGSWQGFVFINMAMDGPSLEEFLAPLPDHFANWDMKHRHVALHFTKEMPCNWKAAEEAFMEIYHLRETHPQALPVHPDSTCQYDIYGDHVSRFMAAMGTPSAELESPLSAQEVVQAMIVGDASVSRGGIVIPEGMGARAAMAEFLRRDLGQKYGRDFSDVSDAEMLDPIQYYLFPNFFVWPGISIPIVYRFRPTGNDPDRTLMEVMYLHPTPLDSDELPEPAEPFHLKEDESFTLVPGLDYATAVIFDQDVSNVRAQRDGYKFMKKGATLADYQEIRLRHLNHTLDKYLSA